MSSEEAQNLPPLASRWPIGSEVSLGPDRGTVVRHWAYSLQVRKADGVLVSGSTSLIQTRSIEEIADEALL